MACKGSGVQILSSPLPLPSRMAGGTRSEPRDPEELPGSYLSLYIAVEAGAALHSREKPDRSTVGLVLSLRRW